MHSSCEYTSTQPFLCCAIMTNARSWRVEGWLSNKGGVQLLLHWPQVHLCLLQDMQWTVHKGQSIAVCAVTDVEAGLGSWWSDPFLPRRGRGGLWLPLHPQLPKHQSHKRCLKRTLISITPIECYSLWYYYSTPNRPTVTVVRTSLHFVHYQVLKNASLLHGHATCDFWTYVNYLDSTCMYIYTYRYWRIHHYVLHGHVTSNAWWIWKYIHKMLK